VKGEGERGRLREEDQFFVLGGGKGKLLQESDGQMHHSYWGRKKSWGWKGVGLVNFGEGRKAFDLQHTPEFRVSCGDKV